MLLLLCSCAVCIAVPALADDAAQIDQATQLYNQGTSLVSAGDYPTAITVFDQALASNTTTIAKGDVLAYVYQNKAFAQIQLDKFEDAIRTIDQGLALYPRNTILYNNKGYSLYRLGKFNEALAAYNKAIGLDTSYTKALVNKGDALQKLGRYDEAIDSYNAALAIDPENGDAIKGLAEAKQAAPAISPVMIGLLIIVIAAVGLTVYYFKFRSPAAKDKGNVTSKKKK